MTYESQSVMCEPIPPQEQSSCVGNTKSINDEARETQIHELPGAMMQNVRLRSTRPPTLFVDAQGIHANMDLTLSFDVPLEYFSETSELTCPGLNISAPLSMISDLFSRNTMVIDEEDFSQKDENTEETLPLNSPSSDVSDGDIEDELRNFLDSCLSETTAVTHDGIPVNDGSSPLRRRDGLSASRSNNKFSPIFDSSDIPRVEDNIRTRGKITTDADSSIERKIIDSHESISPENENSQSTHQDGIEGLDFLLAPTKDPGDVPIIVCKNDASYHSYQDSNKWTFQDCADAIRRAAMCEGTHPGGYYALDHHPDRLLYLYHKRRYELDFYMKQSSQGSVKAVDGEDSFCGFMGSLEGESFSRINGDESVIDKNPSYDGIKNNSDVHKAILRDIKKSKEVASKYKSSLSPSQADLVMGVGPPPVPPSEKEWAPEDLYSVSNRVFPFNSSDNRSSISGDDDNGSMDPEILLSRLHNETACNSKIDGADEIPWFLYPNGTHYGSPEMIDGFPGAYSGALGKGHFSGANRSYINPSHRGAYASSPGYSSMYPCYTNGYSGYPTSYPNMYLGSYSGYPLPTSDPSMSYGMPGQVGDHNRYKRKNNSELSILGLPDFVLGDYQSEVRKPDGNGKMRIQQKGTKTKKITLESILGRGPTPGDNIKEPMEPQLVQDGSHNLKGITEDRGIVSTDQIT